MSKLLFILSFMLLSLTLTAQVSEDDVTIARAWAKTISEPPNEYIHVYKITSKYIVIIHYDDKRAKYHIYNGKKYKYIGEAAYGDRKASTKLTHKLLRKMRR